MVEASTRAKLLDTRVRDRMEVLVDGPWEVRGGDGRGQAGIGPDRTRCAEDEHNPQQQVAHWVEKASKFGAIGQKIESGQYIVTIQFGASTISLIFRSQVTLQSM